jgi:hypothetical protein
VKTLGSPLQHSVESQESEQWGRERSGVYHSFSRAQAGFLHFTIYSARIGLLAQANRHWSLNTRKHALTKVDLFTSMSPLSGVRGMLGALQFVNVVLSNSADFVLILSAQSVPRSLPCHSNAASFASFCLHRPQVDFYGARGKLTHRPEVMITVNQRMIHGEQAARCRAAVICG